MNQLLIDLPEEALAALQVSPEEATQEARRILAIHWYEQGRISQGTGADRRALAARFSDRTRRGQGLGNAA